MNIWNAISALLGRWTDKQKMPAAYAGNTTLPNTLPGFLVAAAANEIGVHETSKNQGPGIERYWGATSYPNGYADRQPWCAAFVAWCVRSAMLARFGDQRLFPFVPCRSARAFDWVAWGKACGYGVRVLDPANPLRPGDIVVFPESHIGIIEVVTKDGQKVTTIEGNTNDEGAREGFEVCRRNRSRTPRWKIIRLPD